jgi:myo-inositol-1(or 4)-monophosphatase
VIVDAARDLRRLPTFSREHGDIVEAANEDAQKAIVATISAAFPDHGVQSDNAQDIKPASEGCKCRWIVDPIDGTANFVHGFPYFAVSIALSDDGELTHVAVLDPTRDELFTGVRGKGAQLNGAAIRVSACTRLEDALVATVFPSRKSPRLPAYLPILNALLGRCSIRRGGSSALDLAHVAAGRLDGFWVMSMRPWEVAAGALLVREAGGRVGDLSGGTEFMRTSEVIAAAPGVFNPLREAIVTAQPPG